MSDNSIRAVGKSLLLENQTSLDDRVAPTVILNLSESIGQPGKTHSNSLLDLE